MSNTSEEGDGIVEALMLLRRKSTASERRAVLFAAAQYIAKVERSGCRYCDENDEEYSGVRLAISRLEDDSDRLSHRLRKLEGSADDPPLADKVENWINGINSRIKRMDQAVTALWCKHIRELKAEVAEKGVEYVRDSRHPLDYGSVGDGTAPVGPSTESEDASQDHEQPGEEDAGRRS